MDTLMPRNKRRIGALILILLLGIGGLLFYTYRKSAPDTTAQDGLTVVHQNPLVEQDTDGDSLLDWEEVLWGTDERNPDSDGDGTPDGDEVVLGRDPLVPGPNDALSRTLSLNQENTTSGTTTNTTTGAFARELLSRYLLLKQSGVTITSENAESFIQPLLADLEGTLSYKWKTSDLTLVSNSDASLTTYGNSAGNILVETLEFLATAATASQGNLSSLSRSEKASLKETLQKGKKHVTLFITLPTPRDAATMHIALSNALYGIFDSLETVISAEDDPLGGLVALQNYQAYVDLFEKTFVSLQTLFDARAIIFTPEDGGYIFTYTL